MGLIRRFGGAVALLAIVSCSLTTSLDGFSEAPTSDDLVDGGATDGGAATDGRAPDPPGDGSLLQDVTTTVVDGCSLAGCFDMPNGFALVAYGGTAKGMACPSGFTQLADTVEGPTVGANACTCGTCSVTTQPSCPSGTIVGHYAGGGALACDNAGGDIANKACTTDGFLGPFGVGNEHRYTPPVATGGACQTPATKDASKLTYAREGRVCQATTVPVCNMKICPPSVAAPFGVCISSAGDVACPAGFANKHLLGTAATFTCASTCTCNVTAKCKGKLNFFATADCSGAAGLVSTVDDTCLSTVSVPAGTSYLAHTYVADPLSNVACNKGGSTAPSTPTLTQPTTVCCN